jgi:hypothetical protein
MGSQLKRKEGTKAKKRKEVQPLESTMAKAAIESHSEEESTGAGGGGACPIQSDRRKGATTTTKKRVPNKQSIDRSGWRQGTRAYYTIHTNLH